MIRKLSLRPIQSIFREIERVVRDHGRTDMSTQKEGQIVFNVPEINRNGKYKYESGIGWVAIENSR